MTIQAYFKQYEQALPQQASLLRKGCLALRRSGLATMEEVCALQKSAPERLADVRNVGGKTLSLIAAVCEAYRRGGGEKSPVPGAKSPE